MSNRKNYNSIVFLTVYLGLVLVGGSAQVLANAATPRLFDIKTEIVVEDDFDNKPDDENSSQSKAKSGESDRQFVEHYAKTVLATLEKSYLSENTGYEVKINVSYSAAENDQLLVPFFQSLRKDSVVDSFNYSLDKDNFSGKLNLKSNFNGDISFAGNSFTSRLNVLSCNAKDKPETIILKNTQISFENNQIFIVTRLPRGSIDSLLAEKDAQ